MASIATLLGLANPATAPTMAAGAAVNNKDKILSFAKEFLSMIANDQELTPDKLKAVAEKTGATPQDVVKGARVIKTARDKFGKENVDNMLKQTFGQEARQDIQRDAVKEAMAAKPTLPGFTMPEQRGQETPANATLNQMPTDRQGEWPKYEKPGFLPAVGRGLKQGGSAVGQFIKDHPGLMAVVGGGIAGAAGPKQSKMYLDALGMGQARRLKEQELEQDKLTTEAQMMNESSRAKRAENLAKQKNIINLLEYQRQLQEINPFRAQLGDKSVFIDKNTGKPIEGMGGAYWNPKPPRTPRNPSKWEVWTGDWLSKPENKGKGKAEAIEAYSKAVTGGKSQSKLTDNDYMMIDELMPEGDNDPRDDVMQMIMAGENVDDIRKFINLMRIKQSKGE